MKNLFHFTAITLLTLYSCETKIENLYFTQYSYDRCSFKLDYVKNGKNVYPIREIITVKVPSEDYLNRGYNRDSIILPDKEIGSNKEIIVKICAEYESGKYLCDSVIRYSSRKSLKIIPDIDFSNLSNPKIIIKTDLYRSRFNTSGSELAIRNVNCKGFLNFKYDGMLFLGGLPVKNGINHKNFWRTESFSGNNKLDHTITKVKNDIKKAFNRHGKLYINYEVKMQWKDQTFYENTSQILVATFREMKNYDYLRGRLNYNEATFFKYYNRGNTIGAVTFKEEKENSGLEVSVFTDNALTNLVANSLTSNVLFDRYLNQYLYVKVENKKLSFGLGDKYLLAVHTVDYNKIAEETAGKRSFYEFVGWITDSDPNNIARFIEIAPIFLGNGNFEDQVAHFLGNEFKRQISSSLGGNFATDFGVDTVAEIGNQTYWMFNNLDF